MKNYQKLRLTEFNSFDIERIMKDNVDSLDTENKQILSLVEENKTSFPQDVINEFARMVDDRSAEMINVLSILHHTEDIYAYFTNGPLFRKDRDAK